MRIRTGAGCLAVAYAVALAACDGGGDPVQQAVREATAANQAAIIKDGTVTTSGRDTDRPGASRADQAFVVGMIEHQREGVVMADVALAQSSDPDIRRMARSIKDRQTREIAEMQAWAPATD